MRELALVAMPSPSLRFSGFELSIRFWVFAGFVYGDQFLPKSVFGTGSGFMFRFRLLMGEVAIFIPQLLHKNQIRPSPLN